MQLKRSVTKEHNERRERVRHRTRLQAPQWCIDPAGGETCGAELLGAMAYVLEAGARWADLHLHYANEEMIVVLDGAYSAHA